jgi:short-subunit dehydrogenase
MRFKPVRRVAKLGMKIADRDFGRDLKRVALLGGVGMAVAGVGLGVGVGLAGWALWRRLGFRPEELRGRVVLITGGSRGLGFAMAREVSRLGARIVICARDERALQIAREHLTRGGAEVLAITCDVANRDDVLSMINQANAHFGRIDVLINNAGVIQVGPIQSQTVVDFQEAMDVMFWGVVYPTLAVLPQMIARGEGRIANITSLGGKIAIPHLTPYTAAKFAAVGFSEAMRAELAKDNVKVTTVVPGLMRTGSHLNADFKGNHSAEFTWFTFGAATPGVSMHASRAARKIINAVRRGRAEIILTPQAKLAVMFHGLFPGLTSDILGIINRGLPSVPFGTGQDRHTGKESENALTRSLLTEFGRRAAREFNQFAEHSGLPAPPTRGDVAS